MSCKSFSLLAALSHCSHVNSATQTLGNINLTEKVTNLILDLNSLTHTFWNIDVTQTMAYRCSQKVFTYCELLLEI